MTDGPRGLWPGQLRLTNFQLLSKEKSRLPDKKVARCCLTALKCTRLPRRGFFAVRCCVHMGRRSVRWLGSARAAPDTPANIPSLQLSVPGSARPTKVQLRLAVCGTIFVLPMETQNRPTSRRCIKCGERPEYVASTLAGQAYLRGQPTQAVRRSAQVSGQGGS